MDLPPRARWAASTPSNPCGFGGNPLWAMRRLATSCVASGRHSEQVPALQVGTDVRFRPSTDEASSFGLEEGASGGFEEIPQPWIGGEHRFALVSDNQTYLIESLGVCEASSMNAEQQDRDKVDAAIRKAADRVQALVHSLRARIEGRAFETDKPTPQLVARFFVHIARQVESMCRLGALPFYAEQAGQLLRGAIEATRNLLWVTAVSDERERHLRAAMFWKDGISMTRKKYEYGVEVAEGPTEEAWSELERQEALIEEQEEILGETLKPTPNARMMLEDLGQQDLYRLFQWESDPAHGSSVSLAQTVSSMTESNHELGGPSKSWDRAKRLVAALVVLKPAGVAILEGLELGAEGWETEVEDAESDLEQLIGEFLPERFRR